MVFAQTESEADRTFIGNVINTSPASKGGIYTFPLSPDSPTGTQLVSGNMGNFGAVECDGRYLTIYGLALSGSLNNKYDYLYDMSDWSLISSSTKVNNVKIVDGTWDETTGKLWAYMYDYGTGRYHFGTYPLDAPYTPEYVATLSSDISSQQWMGLAADVDGTLYVLKNNGMLCTVSKTSGDLTEIGSTGITMSYTNRTCSFLTIDRNDGQMWAGVYVSNTKSNLYKVDKTTGRAYLYGSLPYSVCGVYFPEPTPDPLSPASARNLTLDFADGSLEGTVSFDIPASKVNGSAASGDVNWKIEANGQTLATGSSSMGASVSEHVTMPGPGNYGFRVTLINTVGSGPAAKACSWIGTVLPSPVEKVNVSYASDKFTVKWDVPQGTGGGALDMSKLKYDVTRYPGAVKVATGLSANSF